MLEIKNELQSIIFGNEQIGNANQLKTIQNFLRRNAEISYGGSDKKSIKREEEKSILSFATTQNLFYSGELSEENFLAEGAEHKVYRYNHFQVIKINHAIFYETWLDYFNNLLIHNYFFPTTAYTIIGFKVLDNKLFAVVQQDFIAATEPTEIKAVKQFLEFNGFNNMRKNDYYNSELGIIFEDLHDENVLSRNQILFFIDTVFYLTEDFL